MAFADPVPGLMTISDGCGKFDCGGLSLTIILLVPATFCKFPFDAPFCKTDLFDVVNSASDADLFLICAPAWSGLNSRVSKTGDSTVVQNKSLGPVNKCDPLIFEKSLAAPPKFWKAMNVFSSAHLTNAGAQSIDPSFGTGKMNGFPSFSSLDPDGIPFQAGNLLHKYVLLPQYPLQAGWSFPSKAASSNPSTKAPCSLTVYFWVHEIL